MCSFSTTPQAHLEDSVNPVFVVLDNINYEELENYSEEYFFDSAFALLLVDMLQPYYKGIEKNSYIQLYNFFVLLERAYYMEKTLGSKPEPLQPPYVFKTSVFDYERNEVSEKYLVEVEPWTQKLVDLVAALFHAQFNQTSCEITFGVDVAYRFYTSTILKVPYGYYHKVPLRSQYYKKSSRFFKDAIAALDFKSMRFVRNLEIDTNRLKDVA